jgi:HK97 gp10 family phage protein
MAKTTVSVDGLKELDIALGELPKATAKGVLRRVLRMAAQPVANDYASSVRVDQGELRDSAGVGTKLTRRQQSAHRKMFRNDKASVEMFVGAGGLAQAITEEFGTIDQSPHPALRPAWDSNKDAVLNTIKTELGAEITKAAARLARKQARLLKG